MMPLNSIWLEGQLAGELSWIPADKPSYTFQLVNDGVFTVEIQVSRIHGEISWFQDGCSVRIIGRLLQPFYHDSDGIPHEVRIIAELLEPSLSSCQKVL